SQADLFLVVGTSLQVYPAASLVHYTKPGIRKIIVDPKKPESNLFGYDIEFVIDRAGVGMEKVKEMLLQS
ncbi:MAG TPA: NAD-dependent deacylase, partial [Cyclobacteriaceae bacterium]